MDIRQTGVFAVWLDGLRDEVGKALIASRIRRLAFGHEGDAKSVGDGIRELRVHHGPGYRVYVARMGPETMLVLCGGHKGRQQADIERAKSLKAEAEMTK